jgi:hypothetical protein
MGAIDVGFGAAGSAVGAANPYAPEPACSLGSLMCSIEKNVSRESLFHRSALCQGTTSQLAERLTGVPVS